MPELELHRLGRYFHLDDAGDLDLDRDLLDYFHGLRGGAGRRCP